MPIWFDRNAASHGDGTSISTPKKYLDGHVITEANPVLYIKRDSVFNVGEYSGSTGVTNQSNVTNAKIVIEPYGSGEDPVIQSITPFVNHTGWVECNAFEAIENHYLVSDPGSKIWHKAGQGSALLFNTSSEARQWGRWKDTNNVAIYGNDYPNAPYELSEVNITSKHASLTDSSLGLGTLVYADGADPITAYGLAGANGVHVSLVTGSVISLTDPLGGVEVYGIDFRDSNQYSVSIGRTTTYNRLAGPLIFDECNSQSSLGLVRLTFNHTGRDKNIGYSKLRIENGYFERTGNSVFSVFGPGGGNYDSSMIINDGIIRRNVINGVCQRFSLGGLYYKEVRTSDGGYFLITENTITGSEAGNIWRDDGYPIYADFSAANFKFIGNFCYNNGGGIRCNGVAGEGQVLGNVILAGPMTVSYLSAVGSNDPNDVNLPAEITYAYNVAKGYGTFLGIQDIVAGSTFRSHHNISIGNGTGGHGIDCLDTTGISSNYDNFSQGHKWHWNEYSPSTDRSSLATNKLLTDPSSALSKIILTPDDPTFNYALTLPKMDDWTTTPEFSSAPCFNPA